MTTEALILLGFGALLGVAFVGVLLIARETLDPTRPLHIADGNTDFTRCGAPMGPNLGLNPEAVAIAARCGTVLCEDCQRAARPVDPG